MDPDHSKIDFGTTLPNNKLPYARLWLGFEFVATSSNDEGTTIGYGIMGALSRLTNIFFEGLEADENAAMVLLSKIINTGSL